MAKSWLISYVCPSTTSCGVPPWSCTALTSPVVCVPSVALTVTVRPKRLLAWSDEMPLCVACAVDNELNCANCATKSVPDCGFNGSCEVIWVTSSFKKSACPRVCCGSAERPGFGLFGLVTELTDDINLCPRFPATRAGIPVFGVWLLNRRPRNRCLRHLCAGFTGWTFLLR